MNPLPRVPIPAKFRRYVYAAFGVAGVALDVAFVLGLDVTRALAVLGVLAPAFGYTAASHTSPTLDEGMVALPDSSTGEAVEENVDDAEVPVGGFE